MKTNKIYLSFVLAMMLVVTSFLVILPNASATTYKTVLIQTAFDTYPLSRGETMDWNVPFSNLPVMPKMDIMYVVDTTGSMSSVRAIVAATLSQFTADLMDAGAVDIYFGAAFFGDRDYDHPWFGIELPLGDYDLSTVQNALTGLTEIWGGDEPEDSLMAYMNAIAETEWREDAQHVAVLVTDSPTKIRPETTIDEYLVTIDGACLLSDAKNIQSVFMTNRNSPQLGDLPSKLGATEQLWLTQTELQTGLKNAVILPVEALVDYFCEARVDSITYASDGMSSTDVSVSITSATSFVLSGGETKYFTFTATGNNKPMRYNDATIAEIGYYIDDIKINSARQTLIYIIEADPWTEADKDDAYGVKITSNAQSYDAGAGVVFYWDQKQKDEGVLVVSGEFFETYFGLRIVVKSSNEYRQLTVTTPGNYEVTKWTDTAGKEHNINMIWLQFYNVVAY